MVQPLELSVTDDVDDVLANAESRTPPAVVKNSLGTLCHWPQPLNLESTSTRAYAGTWTPSLLGWKSSDAVRYLVIAMDMIRRLNV